MIEAETFYAEIFIAGDYADARRTCRKFCEQGLCVTVEHAAFIYTGGEEAGVKVGLTNYPRFPTLPDQLAEKALSLAEQLRIDLNQWSFMVRCADKTYWHTAREKVK